jgi:hypothetical protein
VETIDRMCAIYLESLDFVPDFRYDEPIAN